MKEVSLIYERKKIETKLYINIGDQPVENACSSLFGKLLPQSKDHFLWAVEFIPIPFLSDGRRLEYAGCIPIRRVGPPAPLKSIESCSVALTSLEYPFIIIIFRPTLTWSCVMILDGGSREVARFISNDKGEPTYDWRILDSSDKTNKTSS